MNRERWLRWFLRVVGSVSGLAAFCVVIPYAWMDAVHQGLNMGTLPDAPIVGYLARSTSAFYALLGGLLWVLSFDLRRYRSLLGCLGWAMILLGITLGIVDRVEGLPLFWQIGEGPFDAALGVAILWLRRGVRESGSGPQSVHPEDVISRTRDS